MTTRQNLTAALLAAVSPLPAACDAQDQDPAFAARQDQVSPRAAQGNGDMQIQLVAADTTLIAHLDDTPAGRDFAALLPLDLVLTDYAATEKISDLPRAIDRHGAPDGYRPLEGDIAYYAPWGNLAIFHRAFEHSPGLVRLGRIEDDLDVLRRPGPLSVRIEKTGR